MSLTKHKIFKIKITNSENRALEIDRAALNEINRFLEQSNNVYVNHSITILSEDIEEYGREKRFLLISLVYKDLDGTPLSLSKVSKETKEAVKKEIESGKKIEEPLSSTEFERRVQKIKTKIGYDEVSDIILD